MIADVGQYFADGCGRCARFATDACSARLWRDGLLYLRAICREAGLDETMKWGHPCFVHSGRNIAIIGALRGGFRLVFFDAGLMRDPHTLLQRSGPNSPIADTISFTDASTIARQRAILLAYLNEAIGYAAQGLRAPRPQTIPDMPDELQEALDADPELADAFHALTPGRQKSYVLHLITTSTPATRMARIERARPRILAGKGAQER